MIYITGDTHGEIDFNKLLVLKDEKLSYDDYLIICGDAGICWSPNLFQKYLDLYNQLGLTIIFIDGNHENFDMLNQFPVIDFKGARAHQIDDHIFHILRGEIMEIDGKTFLCLGGAHSTDRAYRVEHITWWEDENITESDIENAMKNIKKHDHKVDYVITHCVDTYTVMDYFFFKKDKNTDKLLFIDKTVTYKKWFFGHYHEDRQVGEKKICLYQDIIKL